MKRRNRENQSNINYVTRFKKLSFSIPTEDIKRNAIKEVNASGVDDLDDCIVIKMTLTPKLNCMIVWDLKADIEHDSYDVSVDA